ncbi:hypothetical protein OA503_06030 [Prochlorococcus sp. AH-716-K03]|nr:hypothetical protein [Prochlorococcus sp. AH-716-K03]
MLVVVVMLRTTARKKMYGTALRGICPCLLEIKSIDLINLCKYISGNL